MARTKASRVRARKNGSGPPRMSLHNRIYPRNERVRMREVEEVEAAPAAAEAAVEDAPAVAEAAVEDAPKISRPRPRRSLRIDNIPVVGIIYISEDDSEEDAEEDAEENVEEDAEEDAEENVEEDAEEDKVGAAEKNDENAAAPEVVR